MFRRLFVSSLALLVLSLGVFALIAAEQARERLVDEMGRRLASECELLRAVEMAESREGLKSVVRDLGLRTGSRLTVIAADGTVVADSHGDPARMDNHNARPEVEAARASGRGTAIRRSTTAGEELLYVALKTESGIVVRAALPVADVRAASSRIYLIFAPAFVATASVAGVLAYLFTRRITRPLTDIRQVARSVAAGDFSRKAIVHGVDEVGETVQAINRMAEEMAVRMESLRAESAKLESVVASMQEAVIATTADGRILHSNAATAKLFDVQIDPRGLKVWEVIRMPALQATVEGVLREGVVERVTFETGSRVAVITIGPLSGRQGAVLVAHDATEERRFDAMRREFVANVSHEMRTPISVVKGYVETLLDGALKDEPRAREFLETIARNVERLTHIVSDLLELAKLESPGQIAKVRPLDISQLLDRVRDEFKPLAERKRQNLDVPVPPDVPLEADPDLVERALDNLVGNAIMYTPELGTVRLTVGKDNGSVVFRVSDTGIGIPEPDLARIFERFYRVDKSRSRDLGGTGLGLAIVKHVAQLHGGSVSVESALGKGSTFSLRLPVRHRG